MRSLSHRRTSTVLRALSSAVVFALLAGFPLETSQAQPFGSDYLVDLQGTLEWGDYDGDGDPDLVMTGTSNRRLEDGQAVRPTYSIIYRNDGDRTFTDVRAGIAPVTGSATWGDCDGDGDLDLAVMGGGNRIGADETPDTLAVYRNDGGDVFTTAGVSLNGAGGTEGEWLDYDGDGDEDLLVIGDSASTATAKMYRNAGACSFTAVDVGIQAMEGGKVEAGDYDADGDPDLVLVGDANGGGFGGGTAIVYRNDGGTFVDVGAGLTPVTAPDADWGDFDGDGDLDLLIGGQRSTGTLTGPTAELYRNEGGDAFVAETIDLMDVTKTHAGWGDYDQDGDLDVALSGTIVSGFDPDAPNLERTTVYENLRVDGSALGPTEAVVSTPGRVAFTTTGVRITFLSVHGSGRVAVTLKSSAPANVSGIAEANVSPYRVVVDVPIVLTPGPSTAIHFAVDRFAGITNPSDVVVYRRPVEGSGAFTALPTRYDATAEELIATTPGFGEYVFASDTNPLPVELASFTASASGESVDLTWATASETNNAGFDVERSTDGTAFTAIGFEPGAGTTGERATYRFTDPAPPFATTLFYRLRQVDADGAFEYSPVVEVQVTPSAVAFLPSAPNPFRSSTRLRYEMPEAGPVTIRVFDVLGRQVAVLADGDQAAGRHELTLNATGLAAGTYFVRLRAGETVKTEMVRLVR